MSDLTLTKSKDAKKDMDIVEELDHLLTEFLDLYHALSNLPFILSHLNIFKYFIIPNKKEYGRSDITPAYRLGLKRLDTTSH